MIGKIYEEKSQKAKAIEHYEKFLDLWKDADPGIAEVGDAKKRLEELQEDRELYDSKMGKAIKILDGLKNWEQIWNVATPDKKRSLVNLMTIKVLTSYKKGEYKGKAFENKQLRIVFTPEIEELFTIGLLEADEERGS